MLLWLSEWPPRHVDEPRCDDGEHVELLAGVGQQVRTGDEVMPGGGEQTEELQQGKTEQTKQRKGKLSQFHCVCSGLSVSPPVSAGAYFIMTQQCVTNKSPYSLNTIFS